MGSICGIYIYIYNNTNHLLQIQPGVPCSDILGNSSAPSSQSFAAIFKIYHRRSRLWHAYYIYAYVMNPKEQAFSDCKLNDHHTFILAKKTEIPRFFSGNKQDQDLASIEPKKFYNKETIY